MSSNSGNDSLGNVCFRHLRLLLEVSVIHEDSSKQCMYTKTLISHFCILLIFLLQVYFFPRIVPFSFKSWHPWLSFQIETTLVNFFSLLFSKKFSVLPRLTCHLATALSSRQPSVPSRMFHCLQNLYHFQHLFTSFNYSKDSIHL